MEKIIFDFENWSVQDFEAFRLATVTGQREDANKLLSKLITEWDHPTLAPNDPLSYDELSLRDIGQIIRLVSQKGQELLVSTEVIPGFQIDATKWNWKQFSRYTEAVSKNDVPAMKELLIIAVEEWPFNFSVSGMEELNFEQFCRLNAAVQKAVKDAMQGD